VVRQKKQMQFAKCFFLLCAASTAVSAQVGLTA